MKTSFLERTNSVSVMAVAVLLGGCLSSVLPDPAPADVIYRFKNPGDTVAANVDAIVLRVDRPTAPAALMGHNVVVSPDGQRLATAGKARWAEPVPSLIQNSVFDIFSMRPDIVGVLPTSGARTSHRIHLTVRNFEAQFDRGPESAPLAVVKYSATVSDASTRNLVGTYEVRKAVRADAASVSGIVFAQDEANREAINEIADWAAKLLGEN
ncbi:MAG: ABC-type transport auxiliary lipoprotein family protein [Alphaproteobacteria bacterium]